MAYIITHTYFVLLKNNVCFRKAYFITVTIAALAFPAFGQNVRKIPVTLFNQGRAYALPFLIGGIFYATG